ncbi:hypothetical protein VUR80DRAFT_223 [Thermomyces stellatus]
MATETFLSAVWLPARLPTIGSKNDFKERARICRSKEALQGVKTRNGHDPQGSFPRIIASWTKWRLETPRWEVMHLVRALQGEFPSLRGR